jgi:hypothetical protein
MHLTRLKRNALDLLGARTEFECPSPQTFVVNACAAGRYVLRFGSANDDIASELRRKFCHLTASDLPKSQFGEKSTSTAELPENVAWFDQILLMDLLEQLPNPQSFMDRLRQKMARRGSEVIITASNAGSVVARAMNALARYNHSQGGALVAARRRVFTFKSLSELLERTGYEILEARGVPAPFSSAIGDNRRGRALVKLNRLLLKVSKHLFSYQICVRARPVTHARPVFSQTISTTTDLRPQMLSRVA